MSSITRIGIVLKPHQPEALKTICELVVWLADRGIKLIGGPEIERARIEQQTGCAVEEVPVTNLASDADILSIPGLGNRMLREFKEYRPYKAMDQFRREMGKYVDKAEVARMERYVIIN